MPSLAVPASEPGDGAPPSAPREEVLVVEPPDGTTDDVTPVLDALDLPNELDVREPAVDELDALLAACPLPLPHPAPKLVRHETPMTANIPIRHVILRMMPTAPVHDRVVHSI